MPTERTDRAVRQPAVAGMFYPAEAAKLRADVEHYLDTARRPPGPAPLAVIAPHAGYIYSGPIAGSAFTQLTGRSVERVVLLGPSHFVAMRGLALPASAAFATPLGTIEVDAEARSALSGLPQVCVSEVAHVREHALEVELPFLQVVLGEFRLVPLAVGDAGPEEVAEVIDLLWHERSLVVVSTDLSHYHPYERATRLDAATSEAIERLDYAELGPEQACGCRALAGLLCSACSRGCRIRRLDLRNSGDTAGDHRRVVGYGAWAIH